MEDKFEIHLFTREEPDAVATDIKPAAMTTEINECRIRETVPRKREELEWINRFLCAGLDRLHLRKPGMSRDELEDFLRGIDIRFRNRIILHDYPEVALRYGCGFQFNQRQPVEIGKFVSSSFSCHSSEEVIRYGDMDFVTLSPLYDSISKRGYKAGITDDDLARLSLSRVVALGGVTMERLPELRKRGFGGAALLGDIWHTPEGKERFLKYLLMRNFGLQFITDGKNVEETVEQARKVLSGGGRWIQVRMKDAQLAEIKEALEELLPDCEAVGATLLVDDHYSLTEYCHGVHLGQEDERVATVRNLIASEKIIGLTVNNIKQIRESNVAMPDYFGVGPFRMTTTKKRLAPVLGLEGYWKLASEIKRPFVAIGGITATDIPSLLDTGASGIAMSSAITRSAHPEKETSDLIKIIRRYGE